MNDAARSAFLLSVSVGFLVYVAGLWHWLYKDQKEQRKLDVEFEQRMQSYYRTGRIKSFKQMTTPSDN